MHNITSAMRWASTESLFSNRVRVFNAQCTAHRSEILRARTVQNCTPAVRLVCPVESDTHRSSFVGEVELGSTTSRDATCDGAGTPCGSKFFQKKTLTHIHVLAARSKHLLAYCVPCSCRFVDVLSQCGNGA